MSSMRALLRGLPVLKGLPPVFDADEPVPDPLDLFADWLRTAIAADVLEPHAMTLSSVDETGTPDARVLILKDVDESGFYFASSANSPKGQQLDAEAGAALTFYWPLLARQIRVRGRVALAAPDAIEADFLARSQEARAIAHMGRQSQILADESELDTSLSTARAHIAKFPEALSEHWRLYVLKPQSVEFFQAREDRLHQRLRYERVEGGWRTVRLWP
jgi:pyridoxamine 5'-phosphate oxidase